MRYHRQPTQDATPCDTGDDGTGNRKAVRPSFHKRRPNQPMQDAEFASPREEVAAIGEKGADTELAVNNYLELKRIRIARNKTKGGPME
jgi:hypothetical protein